MLTLVRLLAVNGHNKLRRRRTLDLSVRFYLGRLRFSTEPKNVYANLACKGFVVFGAAGVVYVATPVILAGGGITLTIGATTFTASPAAIAALFTAIGGFTSDQLTNVCETVEKWFVENKYRVVASDGTILLGIKKDNTTGIQELKKDGIDIKALTHLSKEGKVLNPNSDL